MFNKGKEERAVGTFSCAYRAILPLPEGRTQFALQHGGRTLRVRRDPVGGKHLAEYPLHEFNTCDSCNVFF